MPATITGIVFNDLNHNGQYDAGEPGIPNVFLTLFNTAANTCVETATSAGGTYSFSVSAAGTYRIFETATPAASCPPTVFTQPAGFTLSNGPRVLTVTVTAAQVTNNAVIGSQNFSHDTISAPLDCNTTLIQFVNSPSEWYQINVVSGESTLQGLLIPPDSVNAIGYNILDDYIYGYDRTTHRIVRVDQDRTLMQLAPNPAGLPVSEFNVGTFDLDGHLYLMVNNTARFYTVDLRPNSATFMKLVDPANGFAEQTGNFGTALSAVLNVSDWAYHPSDGYLYGVRPSGNTAQVMRVNPATGAVTGLTTSLPALNPAGNTWGAVAMDASGALFAIYNGNGGVFRFTIAGTAAVGIRISTTFPTTFNDATICPGARIGSIADMSVTKSASPSPVVPGQLETFSFTVINLGPDGAGNVTLADAVPLQVEAPEYSVDGGVTFLPWTGSIDLGSFAAGQSETVLIRGIIAADASGEIINTGIVGSDAQDPNPDNNTSTVIVPVAGAEADLEVIKSAAPDPVRPGEVLTYTVTLSNLGPDSAQNVVLTDAVSADLSNVEYSIDGGATFLPWIGSLDLGALTAGQTGTVLIRGTVNDDAAGIIENTAAIFSTTPDPNPDNNTSTVIVPVAGAEADLEVIKSAAPDPVRPGETLTYTVTLSNLGPDSAQNVVLTDAVSADLSDVEYSIDGGITFLPWTGSLGLGAFTAGQTETILIRGTVNDDAAGIIENTAAVFSTTPDPNPDNNTSTVIVPVAGAEADLSVRKLAYPDPVQPGQVLTYTIVVSNMGPDAAENTILIDAVSAKLQAPEYSTDGGAAFLPWTGSLDLGVFAAGQSETILIRGTVSASATGIIENTAVVSSATPDPNPDNNTSTADVIVGAAADLFVVKTASPNPVRPGEVLTYAIAVSNLGPSSAANVTLTDAAPTQVTGAEYSIDGGITFLPWTGSLTLGDFAAGRAETVLIRGTVDPTAAGPISNTAAVSSSTPDPDPDNNTSTVVVNICDARCQSITDLIESVALEEAALAHILNAEGEKLQKIIATPGVSPEVLLRTNKSVQSMTGAVALLENILSSKLGLFGDCLCDRS